MKLKKYKKILCVLGLLLVSLTVLRGYTPRGSGITDSAYYFRDFGEYRVVGEPWTTALHFGKQGYTVGWAINFLPYESILKNDLGQLTLLSKKALEENIQDEQPYYFGFWVDDIYIYVTLSRRNLVDRVWMLMESLEVSP